MTIYVVLTGMGDKRCQWEIWVGQGREIDAVLMRYLTKLGIYSVIFKGQALS